MSKKKSKKKQSIEYVRFDEEDFGFYNVDDRTLRLFEKRINGTITKKEAEKLRKKIGI